LAWKEKMKLLIGSVGLVVILVAGLLVFQGKDGRGYKLLTKFLRPMIPQPELSQPISANYAEGFNQITESTDWRWYQPELVDWKLDGDSLAIKTNQESVWWKNTRGPMLFRPVKGDLEVSIKLNARKASNPESFPDSAYQFGGIMLRDPASDSILTSENYVFNVIGNRGPNGIQVETKSTQNGWSSVQGTDWTTGDVELKIKRIGAEFSLFARSLDDTDWKLIQEYQRADLPEILQLGMIVYSYSGGQGVVDLNVVFKDLVINFH
jgi:hypothetical protein